MLTLTDQAATEIRNLIERPDVPEGCGLRIANDPDVGSLILSLAVGPVQNDEILMTEGARVFLDPRAVELLDDKTLDLAGEENGQMQLAIRAQHAT